MQVARGHIRALAGILFLLLGCVVVAPGVLASPSADELLTACASGDSAAAEAALAAGADPNDPGLRGTSGLTPLMTATIFIRPSVVRVLLDGGADPNAVSDDPTVGNALGAAFMAMNGITLLGRSDEPQPERRREALRVLRLIVERKPRFEILVKRGTTTMSPLMLAAEAGAADVVRILLDAGADPNFENGGGYAALDYAVDRPPVWASFPEADRTAIVEALLTAEARSDRAGADGLRPLARAKKTGNSAIVDVLMKAGAR